MARLSLSQVFEKRRRIKVVTLASILLLLFFGISLMVSNNPKGTKAAAWCTGNDVAINLGSAVINNNLIYDTSTPAGNCSWGYNIENKNVSISAATVTMYGTNHFKSLTINGGTVTHAALDPTPSVDFGTTYPNDLTTTGQAKKVDLVIDGNLTLSGTGSINVDGKGYPGGPENQATPAAGNGYGPGAGGGSICAETDKHTAGGGGGFGGGGGIGGSYGDNITKGLGGVVNPIAFDPSNPVLQFGSGGGTGNHTLGNIGGNGANGGGRIHLKVSGQITLDESSGSYISANGNTGYCENADDSRSACAGGGSGGMIWIEVPSPLLFVTQAAEYGGGALLGSPFFDPAPPDPATAGSPGSFTSDFVGFLTGHLSVKGGDATSLSQSSDEMQRIRGGSGGGGRIVVNKIVVQPVTIKKTLTPLEGRGQALYAATFNPYALQKGDLINVRLEISNLITGTATVTDELLEVKYSSPLVYCKVELLGGLAYPSVVPTIVSNDPARTITYTFANPAGNTTAQINYWCRAQ